MIASTDPDYLDTKLVKQGIKQLDPYFQDLADWIHQKFGIPVLNIYYDKIDTDKNRPRLDVIFEYQESIDQFRDHGANYDTLKQHLIAEQFRKILKSKSLLNQTQFDTEKLLVIFTAFEPIAREEVNNKIEQKEIDRLKQELSLKNVWEVYRELASTTYFFYTNKQMEDYKKDGTTEILSLQYFALLKEHDEFDYIKYETYSLNFDSKENFDNHFKGNWFFYSRR